MLRTATWKIGAVYDDALIPLGINIAQYSLLRIIQRRQPVSLDRARPHRRTRSLDRRAQWRVLARMGVVETGRGEDNHREAVVTLAVRGVDVLDKAGPLWEESQREIEKRLGPVKVTALQDILHSI